MKLNNKKNILILDDDKIIIDILISNLEEEYNVFYTTKYQDALKILERIDFDLILLDVMMPEVSGFEFLEILKKDERFYNIPILFMTSKNDSEMISNFETHDTLYILKPFDLNELRIKISIMIDFTSNLSPPKPTTNKSKNILLLDDEEMDTDIIKESLKDKYNLIVAFTPLEAMERLKNYKIDLILLDVMMPEMNGYEFCEIIKNHPQYKEISVIFLTVKDNIEDTVKAFEAGGIDFISKPFHREELLLRIDTHLEIKSLHDELKEKNQTLEDRKFHLEYLVEEKTKKIEKITSAMVTALESANLYNDENTGNHIKRVTFYAVLIAEALQMPYDFINKIKIYASLHDIGKIGIPHHILRKNGKLTFEEFEQMKEHTKIGAQILSDGEIEDVAKNIVLHHHEKWNGSGYPYGLKGENIPLEARIVAIADVYDALTTERPYKSAFTHSKAEEIMKSESNKHFDPNLLKLFFSHSNKIFQIKREFS